MELSDEMRIALARTALLEAADKVCDPDSRLSAVLVVTDGLAISLIPVGLSKNEAFTILVAACSALEPEDIDNTGELH